MTRLSRRLGQLHTYPKAEIPAIKRWLLLTVATPRLVEAAERLGKVLAAV